MIAPCPCGDPRGPQCPECAEYEREQKSARLESRIANSGLPLPLRGTTYPLGPVAEVAKQWAAGEVSTLVLTGPVGVGKTYLAAAACWDRLQSQPTRWVSVARIMLQLRAAFGDENRAEALKVLTGESAIVLDDLDKVNPTEDGRSAIFTAIDARIEQGSPLLVTTNLDMSEIGKRYGDAVMSRLRGGQVVRMQGADRRVA